jgi:hypothetical protein
MGQLMWGRVLPVDNTKYGKGKDTVEPDVGTLKEKGQRV